MRRMTSSLARDPPPSEPTGRLRHAWARMRIPAHVLRAYLIGCVPLIVVYTIAVDTDGDLARGFDPLRAIGATLRYAGPAFVLLLPVWGYTGWLERQRFGPVRLLAHHAAMALIFAWVVQASSYALIRWFSGDAAAERAAGQWFIWQAMFMMMMYWAAAGGFTAYRAVLRTREEASAAAQAQALLARSELAALRSRLNPHFLFNTLHSLIALTRRDPAHAERALLMFADLLRHVLDTDRADADDVLLADEIAFTRDYLGLEALRLGERLQVDWRVDDDTLDARVPPLCMQPLVENAVRHAIDPRSAPGRLAVEARRTPAGGVRVTVRDDGPGADAAATARATGLGLRIVSRRLVLAFGEAAALQVRTSPGAGFEVSFDLPPATDLGATP